MSSSEEEIFSERQSRALSTASRIASGVSLCAALYMATKAFQSRDRVYHRLILALSLHLIVYCGWYLYGTAAVPPESSSVWGANGTITTCTAQGFFLQVEFAIPLYYGFLSLYSFEAVRHNFDPTKYQWIEKYIHFGANAFPIGSAFYLLHLEAFNPSGHFLCWINSIPFGCGDAEGEVPCERGPQNIVTLAWIFAGLPGLFILLFPTVMMIVMYVHVRRRQNGGGRPSFPLDSKVVARQAGWYLLGVYWTYIFAWINNGLQWIGDKKLYGTAFLAVINTNLMGVWIFMVYRYFRVVIVKPSQKSASYKGSRTKASGNKPASTIVSSASITQQNQEDANTTTKEAASTIASEDPTNSCLAENKSSFPSRSSRSVTESNSRRSLSKASLSTRFIATSLKRMASRKASVASNDSNDSAGLFNIFDGTNASGAFAQYIFDGDSDDEAHDQQESVLWSNVQEHI